MWLRIFSPTQADVPLERIQQFLHQQQRLDLLHASGDDLGWTTIRAGELIIERYLLEADNLRPELDTWAAVVESWEAGDIGTRLMQRIIDTRQLFTLIGGDRLEEWARFLASETHGFYQVDGSGFFEADGTPIILEPPGQTATVS